MLTRNKILLASVSVLSIAANVAFADVKPHCIYDPKGELLGSASNEQIAAAACADSTSANANFSAAAALSAGVPSTVEQCPKFVPLPIPVDPTPVPGPIIPPCPQLTCEQKLGVCVSNLDLGSAALADLQATIAAQNQTIAEQNKTIAELKKRLLCLNKPNSAVCKPVIKGNSANAKTKKTNPAQ